MNISKNAFVSLTYELHTDSHDGPLVEKCDASRPLKFVFGSGRMLPAFEAALENCAQGDTFSFSLAPDEAYGERSNEAVVDVPKNIFVTPDGRLREEFLHVGARVPMLNDNGQHIVGMVLSVNDDTVTLDFNPPLAGETLFFTGKIEEVREATVEELLDQHHGCGGGCHGGCHGDGGCHGHGDGGCHGEGEGGCHGDGGCHGHDNGEGCCGCH
ncbi:MAG: peptidylprolyl isomerase [Bacteroidales bacterium]|nr:peptidylprolyl isomerase [Bacteroidales bacterium]MDD7725549.1 peptidylprolyl isomerase [Bacteroidales bacterium]